MNTDSLGEILLRCDELLKIENPSAEQQTELDTLMARGDELKAKLEADAKAKEELAAKRKGISERLAANRKFLAPQGRKTEADQLSSNPALVGTTRKSKRQHSILSTRRPMATILAAFDDEADDIAKVGRWSLAAVTKDYELMSRCRDEGMAFNEQLDLTGGSSAVGSSGGYLVPVELANAVIVLREYYGFARKDCRVVPMSTEIQNWPVRTQGITAAWVAAATNPNPSNAQDPAWSQAQLAAQKLAALVKWPTELGEDALIELGAYIADEMAYGFAVAEDNACFIGDGTSTYGSITGAYNAVNAGSVVTPANGTGQSVVSGLTLATFETMLGLLPTYADDDTAAWYCHKQVYAQSMLKLMAAAGGNRIDTLAEGQRIRTFLGYPVKFTQGTPNASAAAGTKVCCLGSLKCGMLFGDRKVITMRQSDQRYFDTDELALRATERVNMQCVSPGTSSTAGALVVLELAAS